MVPYKLGAVESRFADIIWDSEPVATSALIARCAQELGWKRTTTYTVLKKLCDKGLFQVQDREVTALVSREAYYAMQSEQFVDETFHGSLPAFIAAFTSRKALSEEEIAEIRRMIDAFGEEG